MKALFEIGQKVVCVDSKRSEVGGLIEGKTYIITAFQSCPYCGFTGVCVGIKNPFYGQTAGCVGCLKTFKYKSPQAGFKQTRFVPLDFDRQADEEIHEALKGIKIYNP